MVDSMKSRKKEILENYNTSIDGLSEKEVKKRLSKYGLNELPKEKINHYIKYFLSLLKIR